jgi:hypothetical protein
MRGTEYTHTHLAKYCRTRGTYPNLKGKIVGPPESGEYSYKVVCQFCGEFSRLLSVHRKGLLKRCTGTIRTAVYKQKQKQTREDLLGSTRESNLVFRLTTLSSKNKRLAHWANRAPPKRVQNTHTYTHTYSEILPNEGNYPNLRCKV